MRKLTIDRSTWLRGEGSTKAYLRRKEDSKQCCLGFYCATLGLPTEKLVDVKSPVGVEALYEGALFPIEDAKWLFGGNVFNVSEDCHRLTVANDTLALAEDKREETVKEIFAKHDVEVEFA
jgi:hypothetical protein